MSTQPQAGPPVRLRPAADGERGPRMLAPMDALVILLVAAVAIAALALSDEPSGRQVDWIAHVLLLTGAVPLLWRRRRPVWALAATTLVTLTYMSLDYPGGPPTLLVLVALYAVAAAGHRWWAWTVTGIFAVVGSAFRAVIEGDALVVVALNAALFVLAALLGEAVYSRQALAAAARQHVALVEQEREQEASRRVIEERLHIARELHDVMAHTVTTMSVQAGAAADLLDQRPEQARAVLQDLRRSSSEAMRELQATVSVLRAGADATDSGAGSRAPAPGLQRLGDVIADAQRTGLQIEATTTGPPRPLPSAVEVAAFRLVQEALTNIVRHAEATAATVTIRYDPDALIVEIEDDGRGPDEDATDGFGLVGLRERVQAVGGLLRTGIAPSGGFRLHARMPTGAQPS